MYKEKHMRKKCGGKKCYNRHKAAVLLGCLALISVTLVSTTAAFLTVSTEPAENIFDPSTVSCRVDEEFDGTEKTNVTVSNTGDTEAYIRAAVVVTWKDTVNGNVYAKAPVKQTDYTIELNTVDWFCGMDGFYYYKYPVAPQAENGATTPLITSCKAIADKTPDGYGLNVEILASAIQSVPVSVVNEKWPAVHVETLHGELSKVGGAE